MSYALKIYRQLNILSVDVSAGAVVCALFFARILDVSVGVPGLVVLGLTVWIIYSADHLLDARRIGEQAATNRHRFYQSYFRVMVWVTGLLAVTDAVMIFFIRPSVFHAGLVLGGAVTVYLLAQRYFGFLKELVGALLYTGGVVLPAFAFRDDRTIATDQWVAMFCFLLLAWINLLLFSLFDRESDEEHMQVSFTTALGEENTRRVVVALTGICISLCLYLLLGTMRLPSLVLLVMSLVLVLLLRFQAYFGRNDRYRYVGDAVFLFPLTVVLQ